MKKLLNKLYYPAVILLALSILSFFYYDYKRESIPDSFTLIDGETAAVFENNNINTETLDKGKNDVNIKLFGVVPLKTVSIDVVDRSLLIPGGIPIGIYIETEGVLVIDVVEVTDINGNTSVPAESKIYAGDYILAVNGVEIDSKNDLIEKINLSEGEDVVLKIKRNGEVSEVRLKPVKTGTDEYMLGIWIRDNTQGVGMLTFITMDGEFGALGHGIYDPDTNKLMELSDGSLYQASVLDVIKGKEDSPGELIGSIYYSRNSKLGDIKSNTERGIYGTCSIEYKQLATPMQVAYKQDILIGPAEIYTSIDGKLDAYSIRIIDVDLGSDEEDRGFMIEIVDKELLELTGGIVQGMSGSPIIQNGKIIGAVTHVLVNDPTKGYGIFIETMLEECE